VLGAAILWSLSGAITKSIELDGLTIAFYRGLSAGLVLLPLVPRSHRVVRPVMLPLGLVFGAMTGFFLASMKATTAANTIYLQYTATFWVLPLAFLVLGERPDARALAGAILALAGIAVIVRYGHSGRPDEWKGVLLGLGSGVAYAVVVIGMRGLRGLDPVWLSAVNNLGGAAALLVWICLTEGPPVVPTLPQGLALAAFGTVQMAIPYALFARGLRDVSAAEAGLIALVEPILNPLWVVLVAHERPSGATVVGGAILLAGVALRYLGPSAPALAAEPPGEGPAGIA
jgi:drug/metabolite transporter (DMT)-like permease